MNWTSALQQSIAWLFDRSAHHTGTGKVTSATGLRQGENEWEPAGDATPMAFPDLRMGRSSSLEASLSCPDVNVAENCEGPATFCS